MANITVRLKDGSVKKFLHTGRAGGSYTKELSLEHGFAVITDEWGTRTCIPAENIEEIVQESHRGY